MSKEIKIYIVRHGETLFNKLHKVQGWCDSPLTDEGIKQAKAVGIGLKEVAFQSAYSSTSERAIDTANIILENRNITLHTSKKFKEMCFGNLEGEHDKYLHKDDATFKKGFVEIGGENFEMLTSRFIQGFHEIYKQSLPQDEVLLVTHGGAIMNIVSFLTQKSIDDLIENKIPFANCSVTTLIMNEETIKVIGFNDTTYKENGLKELEM